MIRLAIIAVAASALAACASAPVGYQAASTEKAFGYRDYPIEENRWRVSYRSDTLADAEVKALRRAAELTLAQGYDWFEVAREGAERDRDSGIGSSGRVTIGGSSGRWGGRSGTSVGIGVGVPIGAVTSSGGEISTLEVIMYSGEKPAGRNAYDARSVLSVAGR